MFTAEAGWTARAAPTETASRLNHIVNGKNISVEKMFETTNQQMSSEIGGVPTLSQKNGVEANAIPRYQTPSRNCGFAGDEHTYFGTI